MKTFMYMSARYPGLPPFLLPTLRNHHLSLSFVAFTQEGQCTVLQEAKHWHHSQTLSLGFRSGQWRLVEQLPSEKGSSFKEVPTTALRKQNLKANHVRK